MLGRTGLLVYPKHHFEDISGGRVLVNSWLVEASGLDIQGVEMNPRFYRTGNPAEIEGIHRYASSRGLEVPVLRIEAAQEWREVARLRFWADIMSRAPALSGPRMLNVRCGLLHASAGRSGKGATLSGFIAGVLQVAEERGLGVSLGCSLTEGNDAPWPSLSLEEFLEVGDSIGSSSFSYMFEPMDLIEGGYDHLEVLDRMAGRVGIIGAPERRDGPIGRNRRGGSGVDAGETYSRVLRMARWNGSGRWVSISSMSGGHGNLSDSVAFMNRIISETSGKDGHG